MTTSIKVAKPQPLTRLTRKLMPNLALSALFLSYGEAALAGGFQLSDHSITALGRSQAGYGIVGDDASAAFFNPAGLTLLNKKQIQGGAAFISAEGKFTNTGSTDANTGDDFDGAKDTITPHNYFVLPLSERLRFAFAFNAPFGTHTDYDENFVGRFSGLETQIKTINLNPSLGYKINDAISVGFGINYQYFDATLSGAVSPAAPGSTLTIEGDSKKWGYNLGAMFSFADNSRLGISYRSKVEHDIRGTATFAGLGAADGSFAANADFTTPETTYLAYTKALSDQWRLSLGYRWTRWSRFQELNVLFPTATLVQNSEIITQWVDVKTVSIGADYTLNDKWTLRAGYAQDDTPVPDDTRSVRTVDADRTWYSLGATYKKSEKLQFDFAYRYISFDNGPVDLAITRNNGAVALGQLTGEYNDINIHTLALQFNYRY